MEKSLNWREYIITRLIRVSGYSAIVFVAAIFFFLLKEGLPALTEVKLSDLLAVRWYPIENYFGILPLITGSLVITIGAMLIAFPFGIATAVFISEIAPLLIVIRLNEYNYAAATAIASVMLIISFALLLVINGLQAWSRRRFGHV